MLWFNGVDENCPSDVEIPTTVWFIGENAFYGSAITSITFTEYVFGIGQNAFASTTSLTSVDFSNNISSIADGAFEGSALESVTIPDSVVQIGDYAFARNNLSSVTLGSGLTMPGSYIFSQNHLTEITLPSTMTTIPIGMFHSNNFTSLTIPSTVTTIGNYAFTANQLTSLTIPTSVTTIGVGSFDNNELTNIALSDSVTNIGANAFSHNRMTGISLGEGVTTIGSNAFSYNSITDVYIPDSVTTIQSNTFGFQSAINKAMVFLVPASQVQALYDQLWYVRLHTDDESNPNSLTDGIIYEQATMFSDADNDGTNDSLGGHIINPALVTLSYKDSSGTPVSATEVLTGTGLSTYKVVENVGNDLNRYYRQGTSLSIGAQPVDGYEQPDSYTMLLTSGVNQYSFLYTPLTPPTDPAGPIEPTGPPVVEDPPVINKPQAPSSGGSNVEEETNTPQDTLVARESMTNPTTSTEPTDKGQSALPTEKRNEQSSTYPWIPTIVIVAVGLFILIIIVRKLRNRQ